ncbi:MAG: carboxylating nicotinate-nucleotide diphosphorylase [Promethearchaeota archaeon]
MREFKTFQLNEFLIAEKIKQFLKEDIGFGDLTSKLFENKISTARLIAKSPGIVCGVQETEIAFKLMECSVKIAKFDGDDVKPRDIILYIKGNLSNILTAERTALNMIMKMSSIASSTRSLMEKIYNSGLNVKIAASRKTTPGFRIFEKKAVIVGGGDPHRWRLDDMILIKDNHIKGCNKSILQIISDSKKLVSFTKKIEIEVEDEKSALEAAIAGADIIMFDNMKPNDIKESISKIKKELEKNNLPTPIFEASGNITHENFIHYIETGVNIISTSEITMHPHIKMDFSLEIDS